MKLSLLKLNIAVLGLTLSSLAAAKINSQPKLGTVSSTVSIDKLDLESKIEFEQPPGSGGTTSVDRYKSTPSQKIQDYKKQEFKKIDLQKLARGGVHGGGGDASEIGINEIRGDILKWIEKGGPSAFKEFPLEINLETYIERMTQVLQPHAVVIGFVNTQQENTTNDPEMRVYVNGQPKQCRGFVSEKDQRPHILCNSDRYPKGGADQYKLIHHEFAGLVGVERNDGASSDYVFSNQLTDFLVPEVVYRLALKPQVTDSIVLARVGNGGRRKIDSVDRLAMLRQHRRAVSGPGRAIQHPVTRLYITSNKVISLPVRAHHAGIVGL